MVDWPDSFVLTMFMDPCRHKHRRDGLRYEHPPGAFVVRDLSRVFRRQCCRVAVGFVVHDLPADFGPVDEVNDAGEDRRDAFPDVAN